MEKSDFVASFPIDRLQQVNPCPEFDDHIVFDDSLQPDGQRAHRYLIDGEEWSPSVTSFVHSFFPGFDSDEVIARMMASPHWESKPYYGMTAEQIKKLWKDIGDEAAESGTEMHAYIECYYNAQSSAEATAIACEYATTEFDYFLRFHEQVANDWIPWRTELRVFDRELKLPGSVDMLYLSPRSTPQQPLLIMYDWKRSKNILSTRSYGRGYAALSHIPNCKIWHYKLQLNVYKALIERNTPYRIESMALGVFHPLQQDYLSIDVEPMPNEIEQMFEARRQFLSQSANKGMQSILNNSTHISNILLSILGSDDDALKSAIITAAAATTAHCEDQQQQLH